jgi:hypothetical protein
MVRRATHNVDTLLNMELTFDGANPLAGWTEHERDRAWRAGLEA